MVFCLPNTDKYEDAREKDKTADPKRDCNYYFYCYFIYFEQI